MSRQRDDSANPSASPAPALSHPLRVARLSRAKATDFEITPDTAEREALAGFLDLTALRKLRFAGRVEPAEGGGWDLVAHLGATVVQPCRTTLEPVTTRIEEAVRRRYLPDLAPPEEEEVEIPEDVDIEHLGAVIDPAAVMVEALALALPPFPRAEGAEPGDAVFTEPGRAPLRDEDTKPLAGLAALRDRMKK
jgi:uncharacterized metal-binding protein YceD (DUF177 family)